MENNNYITELGVASDLSWLAGKAIRDIYFGSMEKIIKADGTPVTNADLNANKIILEGLESAFPDDGIVSEESQSQGTDRERVWYIDPLDGTRGFTERSDQFAVHIGLAQEQQPVLGIVYKPTTGEMYFAVKGRGAFYRTPNLQTMGDVKKLTIDPIMNHELKIVVDKQALQKSYWPQVEAAFLPQRVMISGSEGLRMAKIAENIADLHFSNSPNRCGTWDICAPHIIVQEAGGYIQYLDGSPVLYQGQRGLEKYFVVARDKELGERAQRLLRDILP